MAHHGYCLLPQRGLRLILTVSSTSILPTTGTRLDSAMLRCWLIARISMEMFRNGEARFASGSTAGISKLLHVDREVWRGKTFANLDEWQVNMPTAKLPNCAMTTIYTNRAKIDALRVPLSA